VAAAEEAAAAAVQDLAEPVVEVAPVGAEAPAPVEVYGKQERPRVEVAAEAEELAQVVEDQEAEAEELARVVEDQEAEAEEVAAAKVLPMGVLAESEARVEAVVERASAARAADPVVVELADRAALEAVPAADGEVTEGLVVDLEAGALDQVEEAQADQVEALAAEVRLVVEAQEPSLVNG
jgi:hypothetical protein